MLASSRSISKRARQPLAGIAVLAAHREAAADGEAGAREAAAERIRPAPAQVAPEDEEVAVVAEAAHLEAALAVARHRAARHHRYVLRRPHPHAASSRRRPFLRRRPQGRSSGGSCATDVPRAGGPLRAP